MTKTFFETRADGVPVENIPCQLCSYLEGILNSPIVAARDGSLLITVGCRTLEILERLWEDYCSDHLNAVVEECLVTDDIRRRFGIELVKLKTTVMEDDYLQCKLSLMDITDTQAEHTIQQGMQQVASENFLEAGAEEMAATIPIKEQSQNTQPLNLIHNVTPSEDSLRIEVKCLTLESLERLWQDYRSGQLNRMAEELLVTDDIKRKFNVESITLKTTISEDDYLACKEYLSNRPDAARNGQRVDGLNGRSQNPSAQTANVHDDEEAIIPHASDDLQVHGDKQGDENSY
ncbi:uncharacterized protein LOC110065241 isoform X2 [Orbicella faveolata]|uniref:uncharacterized protein LOC110065241 isoform X2 n=1 Tax=Orbicella faveolata TaxID=48498 RepID=UPI0009E21DBD|nr:uncharacterized protein LOC110065241 isoform X2 [Orbicella faveolata]